MAEPVTDGNNNDIHRQLVIIDDDPIPNADELCVETMTPESKCITTKFTLPESWLVEKKRRKSGSTIGTIDKYYHDPETGRRFRSLIDVERYLREGVIPISNCKMLKCHEKIQGFDENMTPSRFLSTFPFELPDGWIVKDVPRKIRDHGHSDRYYYEPGTGRKFRSLTSVRKHLEELEESSPLSAVIKELREDNLPLSKAFKLANPIKNYGSYDLWKKSISKKGQDSSFSNAPPNKINWVFSNTQGETWNAFVGDELVPDSVKQLWGKRFMFIINDTKCNEQV